jgi:hypothetical protein
MSMVEVICIVAVTSAMAAFLLPVVNQANYSNYRPMPFPWLVPFYEDHIWRFVITVTLICTCMASALFFVIHPRLPAAVRRRFPWRHPHGTKSTR